jgi:ceramide glucosyltransferase
MFSEILLAAWSGAGLIWWVTAWRLVATNKSDEMAFENSSTPRSLSIFKPLPPMGATGIQSEATGLESFIAQMDDTTELLLGIHEADRTAAAPFIERMRQLYPQARVKVIHRSELATMANPKIAWQKILAPQAEGELWLWSDAEIVAPPGFLQSARRDYERRKAAMVTFPYVVREIPAAPTLLDALFVNVELYPGVLLLRQRGSVDFGLGAAMLFSRAEFEKRVDWNELGSALADDFVLGQKLQPIHVGTTTLMTRIDETNWKAAVLHNLRWNKTIRWNRPVGTAARILVLPVLGWLIYLVFHPTQWPAWVGFIVMIQFEVGFAAMICRRLGCALKMRHWAPLQAWSLWRILVWIACWFPWPVNWRGQLWWGPRMDIMLKSP